MRTPEKRFDLPQSWGWKRAVALFQYKPKPPGFAICLAGPRSGKLEQDPMFRQRPPIFALIRAGSYCQHTSPGPSARLLDWNIDFGKHFDGIAAAMRQTRPDICIFQEVDLGARRTHRQYVALADFAISAEPRF
jgi:hypothetical protein